MQGGVVLRILLSVLLLWLVARWLLPPRFGKRGLFELFVVNTIGDLAAHAIFHEGNPYISGLGGILLLTLLLMLRGPFVRWMPGLDHFLNRQPRRLSKQGSPIPRKQQRTLLTAEELAVALRKHGVKSLAETQEVVLEPDGSVSVIKPKEPVEELRLLVARLTTLLDQLSQEQGSPPP